MYGHGATNSGEKLNDADQTPGIGKEMIGTYIQF